MDRKLFLQQGMTALGASFILPLVGDVTKRLMPLQRVLHPVAAHQQVQQAAAVHWRLLKQRAFSNHHTIEPGEFKYCERQNRRSFTIKITINNKNNSCAGLAGAIVDIWHCDAAGNYSEYGGTSMQSTNYTSVHFLRGRQVTDAGGLVTFHFCFSRDGIPAGPRIFMCMCTAQAALH
jgi:hypothetical protein